MKRIFGYILPQPIDILRKWLSHHVLIIGRRPVSGCRGVLYSGEICESAGGSDGDSRGFLCVGLIGVSATTVLTGVMLPSLKRLRNMSARLDCCCKGIAAGGTGAAAVINPAGDTIAAGS